MKQDNFSIQNWKSEHFYNLIEEGYEEKYGQKKPGTMGTKGTLDYMRKSNPNFGKYFAISADGTKKKGPFSKEAAKDYIMSVADFKGGSIELATQDISNVSESSHKEPTPEQMEILRAIEDMRLKDSTILDLIKDKMEAEWADDIEKSETEKWFRNYGEEEEGGDADRDDWSKMDKDDVHPGGWSGMTEEGNAHLEEAALHTLLGKSDIGDVTNYDIEDLLKSLISTFKQEGGVENAATIAKHLQQALQLLKMRSGN